MLVGTTSIENSELLSTMLKKVGLPHQVLNAKQHAREAEIVAQAGRPKMVTIATNMAGRGTDIVLGGSVERQVEVVQAMTDIDQAEKDRRIAELRGGWQALHDEVLAAGGLHIIGTERHESRRIDNQLRGRSGRQGDPGSSRFYLSAEDPLVRIFGGDRMKNIMSMKYLKMPDGEPIEHPMVTRVLESSQRKVEGHNFDRRPEQTAGGVTVRHRDTVLVPWASSLREFRTHCPNMLLYWNMLDESVRAGATVFDFGRSSPDSGPHHFKLQWGAQEAPMAWEYILINRSTAPDHGPTSPHFAKLVSLWQKMPLAIANAVGPAIVRHIP